MKKHHPHVTLLFTLLFFVLACHSLAPVQHRITLDPRVDETSGLASIDNDLLTFNDSGGKASLYRHGLDGKIRKEYSIRGTINRDWEDIAQDDSLFYIADTGNNYATRKDLTIYKINKEFHLIDSIGIQYTKQTSFKQKKKNKFDAEALIAIDDSLVLFSKNRKSMKTQLYVFPKKSGNYKLSKRITYDVDALITGGDYYSQQKQVLLTAYDFEERQYLFVLENFELNTLDQVSITRYQLPLQNAQVEAVKVTPDGKIWISSEARNFQPPFLMEVKLETLNPSTR